MISDPLEVLKKFWGYDAFRPLQEDIILNVLNKKDTLALLPTGGGKSICFQVPALAFNYGVCVVISPLIALMKDQVFQLKRRGIPATAIYSGMSYREIDILLENAVQGAYRFLYVSPERLQTPLFQERCKQMKINLLAIDEAHCISQWGYDFRPPYLQIAELRSNLSKLPVIALTATATDQVKDDIVDKLDLREPVIFIKSFERKNLIYGVRQTDHKETKLIQTLQKVKGTAIVYVRNRKKTREIALILQRAGIPATFYHGGLDPVQREKHQELWMSGKMAVVVATNAFGMGIDKPDVRLVAHLDLPETLEDYYQEAGRAGRDEREAYAVIFTHPSDEEQLRIRVNGSHPSIATIKRTYQALGNYFKVAVGASNGVAYPINLVAFTKSFNLDLMETYLSLRKMHEQGILFLNESFGRFSQFMFTTSHEKVYEFEVYHADSESVIKALLRIYGGELYQELSGISESKIASISGKSVVQVKQVLEFLHKSNMAIYEPLQNQPTISFVEHRYDAQNLPLDEKTLTWRRDLALQKSEQVIRYIKQQKSCRTQFLLDYFGEEKKERCGYCDNCKQFGLTDKEIEEKINQYICDEPISVEVLVSRFHDVEEEKVIQIVRRLIDRGVMELKNDFLRLVSR